MVSFVWRLAWLRRRLTKGISFPSLSVKFGIWDICLGATPRFPPAPNEGLYELVPEFILKYLGGSDTLDMIGRGKNGTRTRALLMPMFITLIYLLGLGMLINFPVSQVSIVGPYFYSPISSSSQCIATPPPRGR